MKFCNILIIFTIYYLKNCQPHPVLTNFTMEAIFEKYGYYINPEELGSDYQGDIIADVDEIIELKAGITDPKKFWPKGVLVYEVADGFGDDQLEILKKAMKMISSVTCITFRKRIPIIDINYVTIQPHDSACNSKVGMQKKGGQLLNLADWCFKNGGGTGGSVAHELIHAIGFHHEHTRDDRDDYVFIDFENIKEEERHNYEMDKDTSTYNVTYDYGSVMHYGLRGGFAIDPKKDIITLRQKYDGKVGQRAALSDKDAQKIKNMYKCKA